MRDEIRGETSGSNLDWNGLHYTAPGKWLESEPVMGVNHDPGIGERR